jgi:hypothetical protein
LPEAVEQAAKLLATLLGQDLELNPDHEGGWRIAPRVAKDRVISTVGPLAPAGTRPTITASRATKANADIGSVS